MLGLGVLVTLWLLMIVQTTAKSVPLRFGDESFPHHSLKMSRYMEAEDEASRMFTKTIKSALIRVIKFYRTMKPEIKLATCFSRYVGITQGRSFRCSGKCGGRAMEEEEEEEDVTVQQLLRDVVHNTMMFMSDLMPQPVSAMMHMAMETWQTTRNMYKAIKKDEMGNCSLEYMSKRFWWWLGI